MHLFSKNNNNKILQLESAHYLFGARVHGYEAPDAR